MSNEFNKALGNFINDFASGDAVRYMAKKGYTVSEILEKLSYPTPKDVVSKMVFDYYVNSGDILLSKPQREFKKVSFVNDTGPYGRTSMRRVVEKIEIDVDSYIECDFGRQLYKSGTIDNAKDYSDRMIQHIISLPWPLEKVWVRRSLLKMERI